MDLATEEEQFFTSLPMPRGLLPAEHFLVWIKSPRREATRVVAKGHLPIVSNRPELICRSLGC